MKGERSAAPLFLHSSRPRPLLVSPQVSLSGADHHHHDKDDEDSGEGGDDDHHEDD